MGRFTDETLGSFRLGAVIGRGAMGEVYEAVRLSDGRDAAVKLLKPELLADVNVVRRFLREVKMAARLDIPFIARVYEVGDVDDAQTPYIAMERMRGESLSEVLARRDRLPVDELLQLLREVGCALDAAHASGVVHRDVKPTNVFLDRSSGVPVWKVLDFGVAKLSATRSTLTAGLIVGTPAYMAPEQAGGTVTAASDLVALGVLAFRALTGQAPFGGAGWADTIYAIATSMPSRPSDLVAVAEDVDAVMAIAMAKDPEDRFRSARCFVKALEVAVRGELDEWTAERAWQVMRKHPWGCDARSIPPESVRGA
jgi:serine/threonine-protein kinase